MINKPGKRTLINIWRPTQEIGVENFVKLTEFLAGQTDKHVLDLVINPERDFELWEVPVVRMHVLEGMEKHLLAFHEGGPLVVITYIYKDEVKVEGSFPAKDAKLSGIYMSTENTGFINLQGVIPLDENN